MRKKVVVLGGGTGMSSLLKGLKEFPVDITAVVSVCDSGRSTGRLREEFHVPAMGDTRKVLSSLSEAEPVVAKLLEYRFKTTSDLNGHSVGNLMLTALMNIRGNLSLAVESLAKVLNLKGKVLPLTEEEVTLVAKMTDGTIVEGEHNITEYDGVISKVYYKEEPKLNYLVEKEIREADAIILSMGSIYTSIIPNLLCPKMLELLYKSKAPIIYTCNIMTQPGETDGLKVSDHVNIINRYLGKRHLDVVIANDGEIDSDMLKKYETLEQKDQVILDRENIKNAQIISNDYVTIDEGYLRHDTLFLSLDIYRFLLGK